MKNPNSTLIISLGPYLQCSHKRQFTKKNNITDPIKKPTHGKKQNYQMIWMVFHFFFSKFFWVSFEEKKLIWFVSFKVNKNALAKKSKLLENCKTSDAVILNAHWSVFFEEKNEIKMKK